MKVGLLFQLSLAVSSSSALSVHSPTRRAFLLATPAATVLLPHVAAEAFDGSGASSDPGRSPLAVATKAKGYRDRITADVKDFNALGSAIDKGETSGPEWVSFFIQYPRREPDAVGRAYAAQVDLVGADKSGGSGYLLARTYAKPNKPPDNLLQYKKYISLVKTLEPINLSGKSGDAVKAKKAWSMAAVALSEYLQSVDLPADLSDPLYNSPDKKVPFSLYPGTIQNAHSR